MKISLLILILVTSFILPLNITAVAELTLVVDSGITADMDFTEIGQDDGLLAATEESELPLYYYKALLQNEIERAELLVQDNYTAESWIEVLRALSFARAALDNPYAERELIDEATEKLILAIERLELRKEQPLDKDELNYQIERAELLVQDNYTVVSRIELLRALAIARAVLINPNATQEQIDEAAERLKAAIDGLVPLVPDRFTVRFFIGGELYDVQTVNRGEAATDPSPVRVGHTFSGWDKEFDNITEDLDINGMFIINTYIVIFWSWNGGSIVSIQIVEHGADATVPAAPSREGFIFLQWSAGFTNITDNRNIFGQWQQISGGNNDNNNNAGNNDNGSGDNGGSNNDNDSGNNDNGSGNDNNNSGSNNNIDPSPLFTPPENEVGAAASTVETAVPFISAADEPADLAGAEVFAIPVAVDEESPTELVYIQTLPIPLAATPFAADYNSGVLEGSYIEGEQYAVDDEELVYIAAAQVPLALPPAAPPSSLYLSSNDRTTAVTEANTRTGLFVGGILLAMTAAAGGLSLLYWRRKKRTL